MPAYFDATFAAMDASVLAGFGESCTYVPLSGGPATVSAAVDERSRIEEQSNGLMRVVEYDVLVSREDISNPQIGEGFKREDSDDLFAYVGVLEDKGPGAWVLRFERHMPYERGGNRLP